MTSADATTSARPRCGVDLVRVDDVERAVRDFGDRYLDRVFTADEVRACRDGAVLRVSGLAARFAAKEAAVKLLREPDLAAPWRDVEVVRHPGGWPELRLHGTVARLAEERGLRDLDLSMSHDGGYAVAVVTATQTTGVVDPGARSTTDEHDET
jgi:holo-[acyl-carrier protein] synthase